VPELPEVETLRRGLERGVRGQQITGILVANPKVLRGQHEAIFEARTVGSTIQRVDRRGKYLLIPLASGRTPPGSPAATPSFFLCIHLKMRGQLLLEEGASAPAAKYHCVSLALSTGYVLRFYDMWTWGEMRALSPEELAGIAGLSAMGREPLEPGWDGTALGAAVAGRAAAIKPALLDQRVVAGVGNIYADESLFRAGIHPERPCRSLTAPELECLAEAIRCVLREAIEGGGTTSEDYVDVAGVAGRYTPRVYDRGGFPCVSCGTALTRIRLAGRGTVFCPACQL
jgi:formamidopyrimidine-DNA glycosylase